MDTTSIFLSRLLLTSFLGQKNLIPYTLRILFWNWSNKGLKWEIVVNSRVFERLFATGKQARLFHGHAVIYASLMGVVMLGTIKDSDLVLESTNSPRRKDKSQMKSGSLCQGLREG